LVTERHELAVTFVVDTRSPTVTLSQPPAPSNDATPSFKGTASATTPVTIRIYEGDAAEGKRSLHRHCHWDGRRWSSGAANPALPSGKHTFTAVAIQESPLGNPAGRSDPVTFTVDTTPRP